MKINLVLRKSHFKRIDSHCSLFKAFGWSRTGNNNIFNSFSMRNTTTAKTEEKRIDIVIELNRNIALSPFEMGIFFSFLVLVLFSVVVWAKCICPFGGAVKMLLQSSPNALIGAYVVRFFLFFCWPRMMV